MAAKNAFDLPNKTLAPPKHEKQKLEITLDGSPNAFGWVRATMLFPDDDAARRQCFAVELARGLVQDCKDIGS